MALMLKDKGLTDVRPLEAGFNALIAAGYPMELKETAPLQKISLGKRAE
ncbi:MAG: hypothetical protein ABIH46_02770 [Chloroflexota bacterium]